MEFHNKPRLPKGFKCASKNCGIKPQGADLSIFYSEIPAIAAGVFTRSLIPGAAVTLGKEIIKNHSLQAIVVNSGISNVGTGQQGVENAQRMVVAASKELGIPEGLVIMSSTGVIAKQLPIELIERGIQGISMELRDDPMVGAKGIITTDTRLKVFSISMEQATITLIGKGSGMVEPNMGTVLVYIFTDARIEGTALDEFLRDAVHYSLNMLSIDTDTSPSDTCIVMANGLAGEVNSELFSKSLQFGLVEMAKALARDGEGATKLLLAGVVGAKSEGEARLIAKAIVSSPLIKTMAYGADPNIGRILMAIGKCTGCEISSDKVEIRINNKLLYSNESRVDFDETDVRNLLKGDPVEITVSLGMGGGSATAYGCDLTEGFIKENAAYYSS